MNENPTLAQSDFTEWLLLVVPGVIWGASFLFIAEGLEALGPSGVAFVRILVGFATLSLFPSARKKVAREDWGRNALVGLLWMALPLSLFPFAEQRVSSALTGMLNGAVPLFVALVAAGMARKLPSRGIALGLAVGLGGAVLMALPAVGEGHSSAIGVLIILAALVSYGFAVNIARGLQMKYGAVPVIWRAQMVALVLTAPLGLPDLFRAHWAPASALSLLALGALGTAVAFIITATAAGKMGATRASATAFLIPPVALALGVLVRHEHVAALAVVGGAICVAGAWVMRRAQQDSAAVKPQPPAPRISQPHVQAQRLRRSLAVTRVMLTLALLVLPAAARAQDTTKAGPNFIYARYSSQSAMAMYSGYKIGHMQLAVGLLHNPRSSYEEVMIGAGPSFSFGRNDMMIVPAVAYTNTGWQGELYLVPSLRFGALLVNVTTQASVPFESSGTKALYVSPGNLLVDVGHGIAPGIGYYGSFDEASAPGHAVGPALQLGVPHGSVTFEGVKGLGTAKSEVRVTLRSSF